MRLIIPLIIGLFTYISADNRPLSLRMDLQETTATMQANWTYTCPPGDTCSFVWWVTEEGTGVEVERDTTGLNTSQEWMHDRATVDMAYLFYVEVYKVVNGAFYPSGTPVSERYVIPARAPYVLVASSTETTTPDSIPYDPSQELAEGTIWLEFTPNVTTGRQGLWSKDFNGYQAGGHLSITLENDSIRFRIQDDSTTYSETVPNVVAGQRNQVAVTFGPGGFNGWLNDTQVMANAYTGGTEGNQNAIVVGANSQDAEPWTHPLDGTMHTTELYDGLYDFSGRWGEAPIIPPPPICDTCVNVIQIASRRVWTDPDSPQVAFLQYYLPPAGHYPIDYRVGLTESLMYELWSGGQKIGYSADAGYGVTECHLAENGELCPVRPFRSSAGWMGLLGPHRGDGLAGVLRLRRPKLV